MTDNVNHIIIGHLKELRDEVALVKSDTEEIKNRLRSHDTSILDLRRSNVPTFEDRARQQGSASTHSPQRIERLEKRPDLNS